MKETWKEKWKPHAIGYTYEDDKQAKAIQFALELATPQIFDFISKEIESAKKVERERIVEALEGLKLETDIFYSKCTPIQVLDQVINLINK